MDKKDYVAFETERQSGTFQEAIGMYSALNLWRFCGVTSPKVPVTETLILQTVERINGLREYRKVPAVFNQGMPAVPAQQVPHAMKRLVEAINAHGFDEPDLLTKEFLEIHPFADGNGRVGSILWNYLKGTLEIPESMPYFFGEG